MIDAPCGSFHWMPLVLEKIKLKNSRFRYHGVDVVEKVILKSKLKYANNTADDWQFSVLDFSQKPLPAGYDLIFSRDALQHLPYEKIFDSLKTFSRSIGPRYLLVGSYVEEFDGSNRNIGVGDYFSINLTKPPFNLSTYVKVFPEMNAGPKKSLILYDIPNYLSKIDFDNLKKQALP